MQERDSRFQRFRDQMTPRSTGEKLIVGGYAGNIMLVASLLVLGNEDFRRQMNTETLRFIYNTGLNAHMVFDITIITGLIKAKWFEKGTWFSSKENRFRSPSNSKNSSEEIGSD